MHNENMSDSLYHFVGGRVMSDPTIQNKDDECYKQLLKVLESHKVTAWDSEQGQPYKLGSVVVTYNPDGHLENGDFEGFLVKGNISCYCEIPLDACGRHCKKYGKFGIGFPIEHMAYIGARPVSYVAIVDRGQLDAPYKGLALLRNATEQIKTLCKEVDKWEDENNPEDKDGGRTIDQKHLQHQLCNVITRDVAAYIKPFNGKLSFDHPENYYTEREWRLLGGTEITPKTVRHIVVAAGYKERLIRDLPEFAAYEIREIDDASRPRAKSIRHIKQALLSWYKKYLCTRAAL